MCEAKTDRTKLDKSSIIAVDFNILLSITDKTCEKHISKYIEHLNNIINQLYLIGFIEQFPPNSKIYDVHGAVTKVDAIPGLKTNQ